MKLKLLTLSMLLMASTASAEPQWLTDFRNNGEAPYNIDFAMQPELNAQSNVVETYNKQLMSGISGAVALASVPEQDGRYIGMGLGKYRNGEALSLVSGFSKDKWAMKAGLSYDDSNHMSVMAGASMKF
jgi:hypothetical protein